MDDVEIKEGRRNSAADQERLQAIHQLIVELGAECDHSESTSAVEVEPSQKRWRRVELKSLDDTYAVVAGYGVVFGGEDLTGDYFDAETDFQMDLVPQKPVFYDHTLGDIKHPLGTVLSIKKDTYGLWVEAQIERAKAYAEEVIKLVEEGVLGWSSGAVAHLVERLRDNAGKSYLKRWPIVEFSLTPTPAEPRTVGVERLKSLADNELSPEAVEPEVASAATAPATDSSDQAPISSSTNHLKGDITRMDNINVEQLVKDAVAEALKAFQSELENAPAVKSAGVAVPSEVKAADDDEAAVKSFEVFIRTGVKQSLGVNGSDVLVPRGYSAEVVQRIARASALRRAGARIVPVAGMSAFSVPAITDGADAEQIAERGTYSDGSPAANQILFQPYKFGKLTKATEELLADERIDVLNTIIRPDVVRGIARAEQSKFTNGSGTGEAQGIITAAQIGKTAASASAITVDDVLDLYYALAEEYRENAVWMMNDQTARLLRGMTVAGKPLFEDDRILGRPVFFNNSMATVAANAKVLLFGDLSYYWIVDFNNGQLSAQRLVERYSDTGEVGFQFNRRADGRLVLAEAVKVLQMASA